MKLIYLKPALKCDSFDVAIGIKIPFFRVLVTIEPGLRYHELFEYHNFVCVINLNYPNTFRFLSSQTEKQLLQNKKAIFAKKGNNSYHS